MHVSVADSRCWQGKRARAVWCRGQTRTRCPPWGCRGLDWLWARGDPANVRGTHTGRQAVAASIPFTSKSHGGLARRCGFAYTNVHKPTAKDR
jgi:hypothetical protein